jgi:hypothetical protein
VSFLQDAAASLAAAVLAAQLGAAQATPPAPRAGCLANALEEWFCPSDRRGVAVHDNLGEVVCAPGACVEFEDEWHCAARAGGRAELGADEPVCEGGCVSPRAADCERL